MSDFVKEDVVAWLKGLASHGMKLELKNISELLKRIGNPQNEFKTIHVAGSDGKGSTCAMIYSILREAGVRAGMYTSPHISEINERISVDGENISDDDLLLSAHEIMVVSECMRAEGMDCTFFESITAMAFLYFKKKEVEYCVVEVGMGGRFDATNVIVPEVTVVTNISKEHTQYLGDTIKEIAFEKAGILKKNIPCVTCNVSDALDVLKSVSKEICCQLIEIKEHEIVSINQEGSIGRYKGKEYHIGIPGSYQIINAAMAIEAVSRISIKIDENIISNGLSKARWPCRMEKIDEMPLVVDVTHTSAGMEVLANDIEKIYSKTVTVFGILDDKDLCGMAKSVCRMSEKVYVAAPASSRALNIEELKRGTGVVCDDVVACTSVGDAISLAMKERGDRIVLVTGSFRMAEEAMAWIKSAKF